MKRLVAVSCGRLGEKTMRYAQPLVEIGLEPVLVAPPEARTLAEMGVAGLLLSGGTDIDPSLYGQELARESDPPDRRRDRMEARLLREALRRDLPVFGICRGLQFLNVFHGGSLMQHHPHQVTHRVRTGNRALPVHDVTVQPGTRLAAMIGEGRCGVNSRHHQAADRVPYRLAISARAPDGIVEALERRDKAFVVAIQWHPEDMWNDARQRRLFEMFGEAIARADGSAR